MEPAPSPRSGATGLVSPSPKKPAAPSAIVPGELLRDALAKRGVPLTSKEVRALSLRYKGAGSADGTINVDRLVADLGNSSVAAGSPRANALSKTFL